MWTPTQDTIGIYWGQGSETVDRVNFFTDSDCMNNSGYVWIPMNTSRKGCFSMEAFGGPFPSWQYTLQGGLAIE